jgi:hypothetical protein
LLSTTQVFELFCNYFATKKCKNRTAGAKSGPGDSYDLIVSQMLQRPAQPSKHSRLAIFVAFHNFQFRNLAVLHKKM